MTELERWTEWRRLTKLEGWYWYSSLGGFIVIRVWQIASGTTEEQWEEKEEE